MTQAGNDMAIPNGVAGMENGHSGGGVSNVHSGSVSYVDSNAGVPVAGAVALRQRRTGVMTDRGIIPLPSVAETEAAALISMIDRATASGTDIATIERMYGLLEKASARAAKSAHTAAVMRAKIEMPRIIKTGTITGNEKDESGKKTGTKTKQSTYAKWEEVCNQIEPVLAKHDLVLTFETEQPTLDRVSVTAQLTHIDGHTERSQMSLPIDTGGAKNNVQGWGSSVSYGKRYTAFAVLNLVGHDDKDTDGVTPPAADTLITKDQADTIREALDAKEIGIDRFCRKYRIDKLGDLPSSKFDEAIAAIKRHGT